MIRTGHPLNGWPVSLVAAFRLQSARRTQQVQATTLKGHVMANNSDDSRYQEIMALIWSKREWTLRSIISRYGRRHAEEILGTAYLIASEYFRDKADDYEPKAAFSVFHQGRSPGSSSGIGSQNLMIRSRSRWRATRDLKSLRWGC